MNQGTFSKSKLLHAITVKLKDSYVTFWRQCIFDDDRTNLPTIQVMGINFGRIILLIRLHAVLRTTRYLLSNKNTHICKNSNT